ncbi:MAG: hypothetical protein C0505_06925 [Leptothrix sp. (in: Bacteria)]|nr:hypothetical protein [Leptothrix sp. (in: b-proteobacteria)]
MRQRSSRHLLAATFSALLLAANMPVLAAPGAHGPSGEHLDAPGAAVNASSLDRRACRSRASRSSVLAPTQDARRRTDAIGWKTSCSSPRRDAAGRPMSTPPNGRQACEPPCPAVGSSHALVGYPIPQDKIEECNRPFHMSRTMPWPSGSGVPAATFRT